MLYGWNIHMCTHAHSYMCPKRLQRNVGCLPATLSFIAARQDFLLNRKFTVVFD